MNQSPEFNILVVEDDKEMRLSLVELLESAGWQVSAVSRATQVEERMQEFSPNVILSDVRMPGMTGLELLASLDVQASPPLVLISAHGDIPTAVQAMQDGAYSFVEKPYEPRRLLSILRHAADQDTMRQTNARLRDRLQRLSGLDRVLLGNTPEIEQMRAEVLDFAETDVPVLISGETGTGKELVARGLHDLGKRSGGPFIALNCAALGEDSFEANMFGVAGERSGILKAASGGTLFLDEVGACPLVVQAKLLRVLEDQQVLPIGSTEAQSVDFRLISATNEDIDAAVADGRLRSDLLFRINTVVLEMPTLRQRRDDVTFLMTHFLNEYARVYEVEAPAMASDDLATLLAHEWPGNVRELRSVAERRVLAARRGGGSMAAAIRKDHAFEDVPDTLRAAVAAFERELIGSAIKAHKGRMDATAEALGIGRRTLNEKIVKLGLDKGTLV
jgi:DNA-binding NtrC family response regulator